MKTNNQNHSGANWSGRSPRSMQEAFGIRGEEELTLAEQVRQERRARWTDVAMLLACVAIFGLLFKVGDIVGM